MASALIRVADAAKDVLPAIAAISTIKGISALTQFGSGFARGLTRPRGFATGGYVPAMVSNGEAFIPPQTAKKIGYSKLNRMNKADRNGYGRYSGGGGISVFKGPGHGTSDSIGPINLPVGSFILREKATKALGYSKGGNIQKFPP